MPLSYQRLYHQLRIKKLDLKKVCRAAGLCPEAPDLIEHDEPLPPFELSRLCRFLSCDMTDVCWYIPEKQDPKEEKEKE